ncbi:MAG TPA: long-chain fatty acid--CoA ligase [Chthoniobacterales bacterium]|nr:long-chain fatty acid--CoA ligase [Chthoniobacterales bacterium]
MSLLSEHWLIDSMLSRGDKIAMIWEGTEISYADLIADVFCWSEDLARLGINPGDSVAICGDYSPNVCALMLALIASRNIVVPLTQPPGGRRSELLNIAQTRICFRFEGNDVAIPERYPVGPEHELLKSLRERCAPGLVLFSSGSTAASKAALHDFDKLLTKFRMPRPAFRTLTFLLLDHIGGINTLFYVFSQGGTAVSAKSRDPASVCRTIECHHIELLPTTPTFLNMLLISGAYLHHDCSSLRMITYGTESMPSSTLRHLRNALPGVELKQTYGLSELGILQSKSRASDSLWLKIGGAGYETKVVDNILWVRSESSMLGYLNRPSPFDGEGWFCTGDSVEVDGEWMRILGRNSEVINVGGEKVYPAEVESVLHEVDNIRDVAVSGRANPISGQVVFARIVLRDPEPIEQVFKRIRRHCRERLEPFKVPASIELRGDPFHGERFKKMRKQA